MKKGISEIILEELREHRAESNARHIEVDKRLRKVEVWQADANGKISIIGAVGVAVGGFITWVSGILRH